MDKKSKFATQDYWEQRLSARIDLRGTGHRAFDLEYNRWFYLSQAESLEILLRRNRINLEGKSAIDVGSGNGFFIDFIRTHGAIKIVGLDITQASVNYLSNIFKDCKFYQADIADINLSIPGEFDFLTAISVLFHIIDDQKFHQAIQNIGKLIIPGGYGVLSDTFSPSLINLVPHVRFRSRSVYEHELRQAGLKILDRMPMYYLLNRPIIPVIGPRILSLLKAGRILYRLDSALRKRGWGNLNGGKYLLVKKLINE